MNEAQDRYLKGPGRAPDRDCPKVAPPNSRLETQLSRRDAMLKHLSELSARAEHLADRYCGSQPETASNGAATPAANSVIGALEQQNDWMEHALTRLDVSLDRLQNL
jgi:hypothetical protein